MRMSGSLKCYLMIGSSLLLFPSMGMAATSLDQMVINIAGVLNAYTALIISLAYILGFGLFFRALYYLKVYGEARTMMATQSSMKVPLMYMLVGSILIFLPTAVYTMMQTTFGSSNILAYTEWSGYSRFGTTLIVAVFRIVQFIGLIAFVKGWYIVANAADRSSQPGQMAKGMTHIFGGVLALNIVSTVNILGNTLGITFFNP